MLKNLIYVVQEAKLNMGIVSTDHDQQFLQWSIRGLSELRKLEMYDDCVKSVRLPVYPKDADHSNRWANLPLDYNGFVQIGICVGGVFINLDKNNDLCDTGEACPCNDSAAIAAQIQGCCDGTASPIFWNYPMYGSPYSWSYSTGSYAQGAGWYSGGYKIDAARGIISFDDCVHPDNVTLVYFGEIVNDMGNALIIDDMVLILTNWIEYCKKRYNPDRFVRAEAPAARNTWYSTIRDLNSKNQKLNKSEWLKLFRKFSFLGIKQ